MDEKALVFRRGLASGFIVLNQSKKWEKAHGVTNRGLEPMSLRLDRDSNPGRRLDKPECWTTTLSRQK